MRAFTFLYETLDRTTSTNAKVAALAAYFRAAPPADGAWALYFLTGRKLKRLVPTAVLWDLALAVSGLPPWLLEHSFAAVGDLAETLALLVDEHRSGPAAPGLALEPWVRERLLPLKGLRPEAQAAAIRGYWGELQRDERLVLNKLLTAELRVGVSATLVVRALAEVAGVGQAVMAHRVMGDWEPSAAFFSGLLQPDTAFDPSRPYPFFLASPLEGPPEALGEAGDWLAEWKWDGIRSQLVRRAGAVYLWSRGEELITGRFPEIADAAAALPDGTVIDGEVLAFREGRVLPFSVLQTRIGRQKLSDSVLAAAPAVLMAYDLLEDEGADQRERPLEERRERLGRRLAGLAPRLQVSPPHAASDWAVLARLREGSRAEAVEGLMLKRRGSPYRAGRRRGDWWKWKIEPYTIDAVLLYAHPGHGRRASLFTDYTFAVWQGGELLPFAKAYSGLSDPEILELDNWVRRHTRERFGPVRAVEPSQVFELAFEGIAPSPRHKSGVAVRFPRILRWRRDKPASEADTLDTVKSLLRSGPGRASTSAPARAPGAESRDPGSGSR
jgi:DNA ligase-1